MNSQRFTLVRNARVVRQFASRAECERARVTYARCDPQGAYRTVAASSATMARYARAGREDEPGADQRAKYVIEGRSSNGEWERLSDTYDSPAEAAADIQEIIREEGPSVGELRIVRADNAPDNLDADDLDDDDQGGDQRRTGRDSYPPARSAGGDADDADLPPGEPQRGGPRTPREAQAVAKLARQRGISAAQAWTRIRMARGR